jgi:tetratricopeptide (TPR) repeat protein/tRNA A-37 threonylcarbamoyl transferase component Bud32
MPRQSRVSEIIERMMESKETPEEACAQCPELLPSVRRRWSQLNGVEAKLETFFPSPNSNGTSKPFRPAQKRPEITGYDIGEILGRGAVGVVYKARYLKLNRYVALKMLLSGIYASATELKRFMREAESVASLRHTNFVQVYEVGDLDGIPYFTMEFVEGGTLSQKLNGVPLPSKQASALIKTLAEAMQVAHTSGIIHRDLKPSNILLTSEGIPKISDFGLARRIEATSDLTHSGDRVGTPCYMAPEQAKGRTNSVGPLADVYSLGAIFYELLTGRPPFQGETPGDTERQLLTVDPVPPSRLNAAVPRDLETICLKCLQKDPLRRYVSASALALDLDRFQRGQPISARAVSVFERGVKIIRRHPAVSLSSMGLILFAIMAAGGGLWFLARRAAVVRAIDEDLVQVAYFERQSDWSNARLAQERIKGRISDFVPATLRLRALQNDADLATVNRLDSARLQLMMSVSPRGAEAKLKEIESAFRDGGFGTPADPADVVAARIRRSPIKAALQDALYDWIGMAWQQRVDGWQLNVAKQVEPEASAWTNEVLSADWQNRKVISTLLQNAPKDKDSRRLVANLAEFLQREGGDGISTLDRLQKANPSDFWTNYSLSDACRIGNQKEDAIRYAQAALALRPDVAFSHENLGRVLEGNGRHEEALTECRIGMTIDPHSYLTNANLALSLYALGRYEQALAPFRTALKLEPELDANAYAVFADALDRTGHSTEAMDQLKHGMAIDPARVLPQLQNLSFISKGQGEQIRVVWQKSLESASCPFDAYDGYAELCLYLGKVDEYRQARGTLLRCFGETKDPRTAERVGKACLLIPGDEQQTKLATDLINIALHSHPSRDDAWTLPYFMFSHALLEYRVGHYEDAIRTLKGDVAEVMGPAPLLITSMSQFRLGKAANARKNFKNAIYSFNWSPSNAVTKEAWFYTILLREAETMFLPHLKEFEAGTYVPQDNEERIELFGHCQSENLYTAAAQLYSDAFAADPSLAEDISNGYRYRAVCAAAASGCGNCKDADTLSPTQKKRWRTQALTWARADLHTRELRATANVNSTQALRNAMSNWDGDPDMAVVHDPKSLQKLEPEERAQWEAFWRQVEVDLTSSAAPHG